MKNESHEKYLKSTEKLENLLLEIEELTLKIENVNSELCELKNIQENLQNRLTQEQEISMKLLTEKTDLKRALNEAEQEKLNLIEEKSILTSQLEKYHEDKINLEKKYSEQNANCNEALKKLEKLTNEIETVKSELDTTINDYSELKQNQMHLKTQLNESHNTIKMLSDEKIALENLISKEKREFTEKIEIFQGDLEKSRQEIINLMENSEILEEKYLKDKTTVIENFNRELMEKNAKILQLTSENVTLEQSVEKLGENYKNQLQETQNIQSDLVKIQELLKSKEKLIIDHEKQEKLSKKKIISLEQQLSEVTTSLNDLKSAQKTVEEVLQMKIDETTSEKAQSESELQDKIEKLEENYKIQLQKTQNIQSDLIKIQELLESKEKLINDYEKQEKLTKVEIISLKQQLSEATTSLNDLKLAQKTVEDDLQSKIDETAAEKILFESELQEKIERLTEIQSNQQLELKSQAEALAERELELKNMEEQFLTDKNKLEEEINREKDENKDLKVKLATLTQSQLETTGKLEEFELKLSSETTELQKSHEKYEKLKEDTWKLFEKCEKLFESPSNDNFDDFTIEKLSENLTNIIEDLKSSRKTVSDLEEAKKSLENDLSKEKSLLAAALNDEKMKNKLEEDLESMKMELTKQNERFTSLKTTREEVKTLLKEVLQIRDEFDMELTSQRKIFDSLSQEIQVSLKGNTCDELKHLEATRMDLETKINHLNARQTKNLGCLTKILCQALIQPEIQTKDTANDLDIDLLPVKSMLETQIIEAKKTKEDFNGLKIKINDLTTATNIYKLNLKSGTLKREPNSEEKLQSEIYRLTKEKKEIQEKLEATRGRNTKMEKNLDELRGELRRLKDEKSLEIIEKNEINRLTKQTEDLKNEISRLQAEKFELEKRPVEEDFEQRLREVHSEYEQKLERLKQKMKVAYSEQIEKLNTDQSKALAEKIREIREKAERQCKKYSEDIAKYKAHISELSSQFWDVGEKLLAEKQDKEKALERVRELQRKNENCEIGKICRNDQNHLRTVQMIEEHTTTTRRHSVKSIQAMGNAFNVEDEEGEVFDSVCLTDLKEGRCRALESAPDFDRISELRMRNSLCQPHLKSSYAAETNFHPLPLTEDDIKGGPTSDEIFNDSLNQSLLPGQKVKKKDRTQTSYKRPGPPTPSKHGHRLSLQGNELRSPNARILRERNSERRTTATPKRLKAFFTSATSRRQDENTLGTPKTRRLSNFFRKPQPADKI